MDKEKLDKIIADIFDKHGPWHNRDDVLCESCKSMYDKLYCYTTDGKSFICKGCLIDPI